jgi:Protein of unknown function (DUF4231)
VTVDGIDRALAGGDGCMSTPPSPAGGTRPPTGSVEAQFLPLLDQLDLEPLQREFLRRRWLDQVGWLEKRAASSQRWYNRLRLITIVGGVIIPALVGLNISGDASERIQWTVFGLGLVVALAAAIEGFFHFSDRWPHYRRTAELLKSEGWQFFQLSGPYASSGSHTGAYPLFAAQVEALIQRDVDVYFTAVVAEQDQQQANQTGKQPTAVPSADRRSDPMASPSASPPTASAESDQTGIAHSPGGAP